MPTWMIAVLKWGGLALAGVNLLALLLMPPAEAPRPAEHPVAATSEAGLPPRPPFGLWIVFGVIAAAAGFLLDRKSRLGGGE